MEEIMENIEQTIDNFFFFFFDIKDNYIASGYTINDRAYYDVEFIKNYINQMSRVLDLGCGTGILEEPLAPLVASIIGVDKYQEFIDRAFQAPNIRYVVSSFKDLQLEGKFDLILLFGLTMYLSDEELMDLFAKVSNVMGNNSTFIIKNQFGINEEVVVNNFSDNLQCFYYAKYRKLGDMCRMIMNFGFSCEVVDIYPAYVNKYDNTHEYALVLRKEK